MKKNLILLVLVLILGGAAYLVYKKSAPATLADNPLAHFAIEDTSQVNKIIITDAMGKMAKLERVAGQKLWKLNEKYFAREDAIETILMTINRVRIRGNLSDNARDNMLKLLATSSKRVEIFTGGTEPAKIYYVGTATQDHTGTIMLLEIPGIGRSEEPYVTHIEGFTGFLSTRFFTSEQEWRYTGIFNYPKLEFTEVSVVHHLIPQSSFTIQYPGGNDFKLLDGYDAATKQFTHEEKTFDTLAIKNYLIQLKKVHFETYLTGLSPQGLDSLKASTPAYTISIKEKSGEVNHVDLYLRRAEANSSSGTPWDISYFYGVDKYGEAGLAQTFNFSPIVESVDLFMKK